MWTREEYDAGIPDLAVRLVRQDGVAKHYAIFPCEGFLVRISALDTEIEGEDGRREFVQYISDGGCIEGLSYDWRTNPKGYAAVQKEVAVC